MSLPKSRLSNQQTLFKPKKKSTITPKKKISVKKAAKVYAGNNSPVKVKVKGFKLHIRSRHPSHSVLRHAGIRLPFRSIVRFGSTSIGDNKPRIECNSVASVKTSANKLLMKEKFAENNLITADWFTTNGQTWIRKNGQDTIMNLPDLPYPIVAKHIHGSRGTGNYLLKSQEELTAWIHGKQLNNYIFEKFYDYNREYRLHVTKNGCFYACRKVLKTDTPEHRRWFRNDSNSSWLVEENPKFDKPTNWDAIIAEAVKALQSVGLDVGAIDVKVQSRLNKEGQVRQAPKFIILETNSAPSFGEITSVKYKEIIPAILTEKRNEIHKG